MIRYITPGIHTLPSCGSLLRHGEAEAARLGRDFTMHLLMALVHCACQAGLGTALKLSYQIPSPLNLCGSFSSR